MLEDAFDSQTRCSISTLSRFAYAAAAAAAAVAVAVAGAAAAPIIRCRRVIAEPRSMKCHWSDAQSGIDRDRAEGDSCLRSLSGRRGGLGIEEGGRGAGWGGLLSPTTPTALIALVILKRKKMKK